MNIFPIDILLHPHEKEIKLSAARPHVEFNSFGGGSDFQVTTSVPFTHIDASYAFLISSLLYFAAIYSDLYEL